MSSADSSKRLYLSSALPDHLESDFPAAYAIILLAERHALEEYASATQATVRNDAEKCIINARIVGGFFERFHAEKHRFARAAVKVALDVLSQGGTSGADSDKVVYGLGQLWCDTILRSFRTVNKPYLPPSSHPSRMSFNSLQSTLIKTIDASGSDYSTSRKKSLARDGFACVITGIFNTTSVETIAELSDSEAVDAKGDLVIESCHILNESAMQGVDPLGTSGSEKIENKASHETSILYNNSQYQQTSNTGGMLAILSTFGLHKIVEDVSRKDGIHNPRNLISLTHDFHKLFDALRIWFEETDKDHAYTLRCSKKRLPEHMRRYVGQVVDFKRPASLYTLPALKTSLEELLPDQNLLALHAICARVADMSGVAEAFDKMDMDMEETTVLAEDGSAGDLLYNLLVPYRNIATSA